MRSAADLKKEIERRLKAYLKRDKNGIRHELLTIFVNTKSLSIARTHELLAAKFSVSIQSVASMVGTIASKIGILRIKKDKDNATAIYELKDQYADLVRRMVGAV